VYDLVVVFGSVFEGIGILGEIVTINGCIFWGAAVWFGEIIHVLAKSGFCV